VIFYDYGLAIIGGLLVWNLINCLRKLAGWIIMIEYQ